jgi:hypothetical protein
MRRVIGSLFIYTGHVPGEMAICAKCGTVKESPHRSVNMAGWYAHKDGERVTDRLCPDCGKRLAEQLRAEQVKQMRGVKNDTLLERYLTEVSMIQGGYGDHASVGEVDVLRQVILHRMRHGTKQ